MKRNETTSKNASATSKRSEQEKRMILARKALIAGGAYSITTDELIRMYEVILREEGF